MSHGSSFSPVISGSPTSLHIHHTLDPDTWRHRSTFTLITWTSGDDMALGILTWNPIHHELSAQMGTPNMHCRWSSCTCCPCKPTCEHFISYFGLDVVLALTGASRVLSSLRSPPRVFYPLFHGLGRLYGRCYVLV